MRHPADPVRELLGGRRHVLGGYEEFGAPPGLARGVRAVWRYRTPAAGGSAHRVLPSSGVSVCVQYGPERGGRGGEPAVMLLGPVRRPRWFRPAPGLVLEAVELAPQWARRVLGADPADHVNAIEPLETVDARGAATLVEAASEALARDGSALPALVRWVGARWEARRAEGGALLADAGMEVLLGGPAAAPVRRAAAALDVSARHLRRVVREATGSTPKLLHRLDRLNRVVAAADRTSRPRWAQLAPAHGFYDQAHLVRELRALAGVSPAALHAERRAEHVPFLQSERARRG